MILLWKEEKSPTRLSSFRAVFLPYSLVLQVSGLIWTWGEGLITAIFMYCKCLPNSDNLILMTCRTHTERICVLSLGFLYFFLEVNAERTMGGKKSRWEASLR